jgi:hypothetical protein
MNIKFVGMNCWGWIPQSSLRPNHFVKIAGFRLIIIKLNDRS